MSQYNREPVFKPHSITRDYEIKWQKNLGSGVSGPVRLCIHKESGKEYALKILLDRPKARKEVSLHWRCSGSNHVVRVISVYANEVILPGDSVPKKRILLVMELMEGGELFEYITRRRNFTEREASEILKQVAQAVQYCHHLNIAHRDIKPENLLLEKKAEVGKDGRIRVKLADFGFAKIDNGDLTTPQFTPYYVAPQVLEAQKRQKEIRSGQRSATSPYYYDKSCDMWSLGVILYIMLCGYPPISAELRQGMRREEEGFYLKPVGKSQNKLLSNRKRVTKKQGEDGAASPATANQESLKSLKELKDLCVMPPPLPSNTEESYADSALIEGVKKALMYNEGHTKLLSAVQAESWNGTEFTAMVNRQRLADSLQSI